MSETAIPTAQELAVAYRKVADRLLVSGHSVTSDEDVDLVVYSWGPEADDQDWNLVHDAADGRFGDVAREAAKLFNATL